MDCVGARSQLVDGADIIAIIIDCVWAQIRSGELNYATKDESKAQPIKSTYMSSPVLAISARKLQAQRPR